MGEAELRILAGERELAGLGKIERVVVDYATAMTAGDVDIDDALFERLSARLDGPQIVELTAVIAWENYRARFNHALGMKSEGFSGGEFCPLPQRPEARLPLHAATGETA